MARSVYSRVVIDIRSGEVIERDFIAYDGPWELAKGGNSQAEMNRANDISQQQLNMQQQQLNLVNPVQKQIINNGGMLPSTEAAMRSTALNNLGSQYQNLYGSLSSSLAARGLTGGTNAGGGGIASQFGALGAQEAGQATQALEGVQLAKAQGLQTALGQSLGEASSTGQLGVGALGSGVTAANNVDQAQTGFWGSLVGGLAGLGGSWLGRPAGGCWVAAALYGGWFAPETVTIRAWLQNTWYMAPFCALYRHIGKRWAALLPQSPMLKRLSKALFDTFLRLAKQ